MIIRKIRNVELEQLLQLYRDLNPDDPLLPIDDRLRAHWRTILATDGLHIIVADVAGAVVSSCVLCVIPNLTRGAKPYALIENVVTRADHRRQGLATAVLRFAQQMAWEQGCYKVMLMTGSTQEATQKFYEKAGFARGLKTAFLARPPMDS